MLRVGARAGLNPIGHLACGRFARRADPRSGARGRPTSFSGECRMPEISPPFRRSSGKRLAGLGPLERLCRGPVGPQLHRFGSRAIWVNATTLFPYPGRGAMSCGIGRGGQRAIMASGIEARAAVPYGPLGLVLSLVCGAVLTAVYAALFAACWRSPMRRSSAGARCSPRSRRCGRARPGATLRRPHRLCRRHRALCGDGGGLPVAGAVSRRRGLAPARRLAGRTAHGGATGATGRSSSPRSSMAFSPAPC